MVNKHKANLLNSMKSEMSSSGRIANYLAWMRAENPQGAQSLEDDIAKTFTTDEGLRVLLLFENSILKSELPNGSDDRALREHNAVRNFVLEIRRIVAHGRR